MAQTKILKRLRRTNEQVIALMIGGKYQQAYEAVRDSNVIIVAALTKTQPGRGKKIKACSPGVSIV